MWVRLHTHSLCVCLSVRPSQNIYAFLPRANDVSDKVMLYTCLSFCPQGGLCVNLLPVWLPGPVFHLVVSVPSPVFLLGDFCPGEDSLSRGSLSRGLSRGVSVQRGFCSGGFCPGVFVWRAPSQNQKGVQYASHLNAFLQNILLYSKISDFSST